MVDMPLNKEIKPNDQLCFFKQVIVIKQLIEFVNNFFPSVSFVFCFKIFFEIQNVLACMLVHSKCISYSFKNRKIQELFEICLSMHLIVDSDISGKIRMEFFQVVAVSVLLYSGTS